MSTISAREPSKGFPFSNPWDIADGITTEAATGTPYFYFTDMEMSVIDLNADNRLSISVTLNQGGYCKDQGMGAQDPPCGRVILTGSSVKLEDGSVEAEFAKETLFAKHPKISLHLSLRCSTDHVFVFS